MMNQSESGNYGSSETHGLNQEKSDSPSHDTYLLLRSYAIKHKSSRIEFNSFVTYVRRYIEHYGYKYPQLMEFAQNTSKLLRTYLNALAEDKKCSLEYSGKDLSIVHFPQFFLEIIQNVYKKMENDQEMPFPTEEQLGLSIPHNLVSVVNIKTDFVNALGEKYTETPNICRLVFPENINSIIVTSNIIEKKLLEYSVYKMRSYLSNSNNAGYVQRKLLPALKGNDQILRESINAVITRPGKSINNLVDPTDFSFRFWAHFANLVIQEFKEKKEKLAEEHGYCQAAYLIGFYNVYNKGVVQKENEKQIAIKNFEAQLRKPPYAFTFKDLYSLKDSKGLPLIRKSTKDVFIEFLENKTKADSYKNLPELVRIKSANKKEYYINKDMIIPVFLKKLYEASNDMREFYANEWEKNLKQNKRTLVMTDDKEFARDVEIVLKTRAPFFNSLLKFNLLFLAKEESNISYEQSRDIDRCFDEKHTRLKTFPEILRLNRKEIYDTAKLHLPLWQRISFLRPLFMFFRTLLLRIRRNIEKSNIQERGKKKRKAKTAEETKESVSSAGAGGSSSNSKSAAVEQRAAYKKAVRALKVYFVGQGATLSDKMDELIEKWNPIFDPQARQDLIQDVNAMVRDYLRGLKRGFKIKPPDAARIETLSEKLSQNNSFDRIPRKEYFKHYIQIYMVKLLGEK